MLDTVLTAQAAPESEKSGFLITRQLVPVMAALLLTVFGAGGLGLFLHVTDSGGGINETTPEGIDVYKTVESSQTTRVMVSHTVRDVLTEADFEQLTEFFTSQGYEIIDMYRITNEYFVNAMTVGISYSNNIPTVTTSVRSYILEKNEDNRFVTVSDYEIMPSYIPEWVDAATVFFELFFDGERELGDRLVFFDLNGDGVSEIIASVFGYDPTSPDYLGIDVVNRTVTDCDSLDLEAIMEDAVILSGVDNQITPQNALGIIRSYWFGVSDRPVPQPAETTARESTTAEMSTTFANSVDIPTTTTAPRSTTAPSGETPRTTAVTSSPVATTPRTTAVTSSPVATTPRTTAVTSSPVATTPRTTAVTSSPAVTTTTAQIRLRPTPAGYSDNDYQKLLAFIVQNERIFPPYRIDLDDPYTWRESGDIQILWNNDTIRSVTHVKFKSSVSGKLDLSGFKALETIYIEETRITEIDVTDTPSLWQFDAGYNNLTTISSLENSTSIKNVWVGGNFLNLSDPAVQHSIERIRAAVDRNGGEFCFEQQRRP
jgi:hypothetical protein